MMSSDTLLINKLKLDTQNLDKFCLSLELSFKKCKSIGLKNNYSFEEMESYDSLTFKFARTSDIYTQKVLITIFHLLRETPVSFIDKINLSEKLEIITSSEDLKSIRDLRNQISHEYQEEDIIEIYTEVLIYTEKLLSSINKTKDFISNKGWL